MFIDLFVYVYCVWDELEVGGVVINDVLLFCVDNMLYGGVKDLGFGWEGICYVIEDMIELWLMVVWCW